MDVISGSCHCGAVIVRFAPSRPVASLAVRACQCSFCRRHGARTTTDPSGTLEIVVAEQAALRRYRFGLETADYLVCGRCGVYVAAVIASGDRAWSTLNTNILELPDGVELARAAPVHYDGEDRDARIARRVAGWTPTEVRLAR